MLQDKRGTSELQPRLAAKATTLLSAAVGAKLPVSVGVLFPDPVISVVLEQCISCGVAHLKRGNIRILKMCNVIAAE